MSSILMNFFREIYSVSVSTLTFVRLSLILAVVQLDQENARRLTCPLLHVKKALWKMLLSSAKWKKWRSHCFYHFLELFLAWRFSTGQKLSKQNSNCKSSLVNFLIHLSFHKLPFLATHARGALCCSYVKTHDRLP